MFDEAEFLRLATTDRKTLRTIALRHLNRRFVSDVEDVLQSVFLYAWEHRNTIETNTGGYLSIAVMRTAAHWRRSERANELPGGHMEEIPLPAAGTPEALALHAEAEHNRATAWLEIRSKLSAPVLKNLEEWEARDYLNHNHAQALRASKARGYIERITGRRFRYVNISPKKRKAAQA